MPAVYGAPIARQAYRGFASRGCAKLHCRVPCAFHTIHLPERCPRPLWRAAGLLALALLGGCDYLRPFEQVCETRLKPAEIAVEAAPTGHITDFSMSSAQLSARGADMAGRTVLGLIETKLSSSLAMSANGVVKPLSGRYCMRPSLQLRLAFDPTTIFVASEYPKGSCRSDITMGHEMKHLRVYDAFLVKLGARLEAELQEKFGNRIHYFANVAEGEKYLSETTRTLLAPYLERGMEQVNKLQTEVDSPEEYFRLDQFQSRCSDN